MRYFYRGSTLLIRFKTKEMTDRQTITGYSIGATIMGYEGVVDPVDEYSFNITFDEAITAVLPEGTTPIVLSLTKDDVTALGQVKGLAALEPSINETCGITDVVTCEVTIEDVTLNYGMVFNNVVTYQDLTDAQKIEMLSGIRASLILSGDTAPAVIPDFIGQFYIKTTATTACYQATGIAGVGDWKLIG